MPDLSELRRERIKKLKALQGTGTNPFPETSHRTHTIAKVLACFDNLLATASTLIVAGRIRAVRVHGKAAFIDLADATGKIQLFLSEADMKEFAMFLPLLDEGDFIDATGQAYLSQSQQKSLKVNSVRMLAKALLPLPGKWFGLKDEEERFRKRYLDILLNEAARDIFVKKAAFWRSARECMNENGFMEVETPVLESSPGGADARPFITHLRALDIDLYLRISLELYQKRLIVAGFEKIYEIGRIFRNEGIDKEHLQDYTQLEFYWAYADEHQLMRFAQTLYRKIIFDTLGSYTHQWQDHTINWKKAWKMYNYCELAEKALGLRLDKATDEQLREKAREMGLQAEKHLGRGRIIDLLFKKAVRPSLIQPGFLLHPPVDVEPLAKRLENDPRRVARMQVVACGSELGKGFSELNDPLDQRARLEEQLRLRQAGDEEAQRLDEDFIEALEYGMPPTAGFGFSERLFSIIINKNVRETTYFPLMRPKSNV